MMYDNQAAGPHFSLLAPSLLPPSCHSTTVKIERDTQGGRNTPTDMSTTRHRPATGDENVYGAGPMNTKGGAAAAGPPTKPGASSSSSSSSASMIGPSGLTGGKTVARKALGALSSSSSSSSSMRPEGQEEDQALIKQGLGNKG